MCKVVDMQQLWNYFCPQLIETNWRHGASGLHALVSFLPYCDIYKSLWISYLPGHFQNVLFHFNMKQAAYYLNRVPHCILQDRSLLQDILCFSFSMQCTEMQCNAWLFQPPLFHVTLLRLKILTQLKTFHLANTKCSGTFPFLCNLFEWIACLC